MPLKRNLWAFLMLILALPSIGTTWAPSYPYTQHIAGQKVTIHAIAYNPHGGGDVLYGITKVYYAGKLLYTMDGYYRRRIFTSDDGQFLAVVHSRYDVETNPYNSIQEYEDILDHVAIEVFKMGKPFKKFTVRDVVDSPTITPYSLVEPAEQTTWYYFYWNYFKDLSGKAKKNADSMTEDNLNRHPVFVLGNCLYMLTNSGTAVKLDFSNMKLEQIPFDQVIPDKAKFNPPKLTRRYWKVKLPKHLEEPKVKGGRTFDKAVADLFGLSETGFHEKTSFVVFIDMMIDRTGKCVGPQPYVVVHDQRKSDSFANETINKEMTQKLEEWVGRQRFQTRKIPRRFDKYYFECVVDLR